MCKYVNKIESFEKIERIEKIEKWLKNWTCMVTYYVSSRQGISLSGCLEAIFIILVLLVTCIIHKRQLLYLSQLK